MTRSRWTVLGLAAVSAVLYTWGLSRVGYGNTYYAAAVRSATTSWKAFFFGSLDPGSFITVDKPPFALWVQGLSARLFGFSSWSMLMPGSVRCSCCIGWCAAGPARWPDCWPVWRWR